MHNFSFNFSFELTINRSIDSQTINNQQSAIVNINVKRCWRPLLKSGVRSARRLIKNNIKAQKSVASKYSKNKNKNNN